MEQLSALLDAYFFEYLAGFIIQVGLWGHCFVLNETYRATNRSLLATLLEEVSSPLLLVPPDQLPGQSQ